MVVIELKKGRGSDRVVGQIGRYLAWVQERYQTDVRGIIISQTRSKKLEYAVKSLRFPVTVQVFKKQLPIAEQINYCPNCGKPNHQSAKYCLKCGTEISDILEIVQGPAGPVQPSSVPRGARIHNLLPQTRIVLGAIFLL